MADVTKRMLDLLSALQTGREYRGGELRDILGVSARTVRRDVERLREYGYPVRARSGPGGGYRMVSGRSMPPLLLDDDEAIATQVALTVLAAMPDGAAVALPAAAARARAKLDQFLPARLRARAAALRDSVDVAWPAAPAVDPGVLTLLGEAIGRRRLVRFGYRGGDAGPESERRVEPYRQLHRNLRWYLLAWDLDREDWRTFRLDRMTGVAASTFGFTARSLPAESTDAHLLAGLRRDRVRVVLEVRASAEAVRDAMPWEDVELERLDGGRTRAVVHVPDWEWLTHTLAILPPATVVEPLDFADRLGAFGRRLLDAAGDRGVPETGG